MRTNFLDQIKESKKKNDWENVVALYEEYLNQGQDCDNGIYADYAKALRMTSQSIKVKVLSNL